MTNRALARFRNCPPGKDIVSALDPNSQVKSRRAKFKAINEDRYDYFLNHCL